jgi:phage baseplate assembly protein W
MKTIQILNGDLNLSGGNIQFLTGSQKLLQDLQFWLEEPIGTGFTTPGYGSTLSQMVGQAQSSSSFINDIESEITRIIQLYQANQILDLQTAQNSAQLANWNRSEIIKNVVSMSTSVQNTSVVTNIVIENLNNNLINVTLFIDSNGVSVTNG